MLTNMYGIGLSVESMNQYTRTMNLSIGTISYDMGDMSHSMRPIDRMNNVLPW
jgi:hypothetical protein